MSLEHVGTPSISSIVPTSLRIAKSADNLGPISASASTIRATGLNETVMTLKNDLENVTIEDDRDGMKNEEQTPTQKQLHHRFQVENKSLDSVQQSEEQMKPPQAPTPLFAKTSMDIGSVTTANTNNDLNQSNTILNTVDAKAQMNEIVNGSKSKGMESMHDAITTETIKRVGGMIGGHQIMTPSALLKSAYNGNHGIEEGVGKDSTLEQVTTFQYKMIRSIVEEVVQDYHEQIRRDVQNVHIEIIKQFSQQKVYLVETYY